MCERAWCPARLKPVDVLEMPQVNLRRPTPVPFTVHAGQCVVVYLHCFPSRFSYAAPAATSQ
jgi:hypothetical protein